MPKCFLFVSTTSSSGNSFTCKTKPLSIFKLGTSAIEFWFKSFCFSTSFNNKSFAVLSSGKLSSSMGTMFSIGFSINIKSSLSKGGKSIPFAIVISPFTVFSLLLFLKLSSA